VGEALVSGSPPDSCSTLDGLTEVRGWLLGISIGTGRGVAPDGAIPLKSLAGLGIETVGVAVDWLPPESTGLGVETTAAKAELIR
jgi:hypothetical protein